MNKKTKSSLNIGPKIGFAVNYDQLPNWNFFVFFTAKEVHKTNEWSKINLQGNKFHSKPR